MNLKPKEIWMHCLHEPQGWWWDEIKQWENKDGTKVLRVEKARDVLHVGSKEKVVSHVSLCFGPLDLSFHAVL